MAGIFRPVKKAITGKDDYRGPGELKLIDAVTDEHSIEYKKVMFRGRIGNPVWMDARASISLLDTTSGRDNAMPVISVLDRLQEKETVTFQQDQAIGGIGETTYFPDWVEIGRVPHEFIVPPRSGLRNIMVVLRFYDKRMPFAVRNGFRESGLSYNFEASFSHQFTEIGYKERAENFAEAQQLCLKLAVGVAVSDGSLDDSEGILIKNWIRKQIASEDESETEILKENLNAAFKEAYTQLKSNPQAINTMMERLAQIGDKKTKYDTVELCLDVMAADGEAAPEEMEVIRKMAGKLGIKMDELEKMREKVTLDISTEKTSSMGLEGLVGIEESWDQDQKRKHLTKEFQKWSNRLNALSDGPDREAAQKMLDNIAKLRKMYG